MAWGCWQYPCSISHAWGEEFAFTTPTIFDEQLQPLESAAVKTIDDVKGNVALLTEVGGEGAVGLALDTDGDVYFGVVTSSAPYQVQLNRRTGDGEVVLIGTIIDSSGGVIPIAGQSLDLAAGIDGKVYFTAPLILAGEDGTEGVLAPAAVRRIDPESAEIETVFELDSSAPPVLPSTTPARSMSVRSCRNRR